MIDASPVFTIHNEPIKQNITSNTLFEKRKFVTWPLETWLFWTDFGKVLFWKIVSKCLESWLWWRRWLDWDNQIKSPYVVGLVCSGLFVGVQKKLRSKMELLTNKFSFLWTEAPTKYFCWSRFSFQAKALTTAADGPDMRLCSKNQLLWQAWVAATMFVNMQKLKVRPTPISRILRRVKFVSFERSTAV